MIKHKAAIEEFKERTTWTEFDFNCQCKRGFLQSDVTIFADSLQLISRAVSANIDEDILEHDVERCIITYGYEWKIIPSSNKYMLAERFFYRHFTEENVIIMVRVYLKAKKKYKSTILEKFNSIFSIARLGEGIVVTVADPIIEKTAAKTQAVANSVVDNIFLGLRGIGKDVYRCIRTFLTEIYRSWVSPFLKTLMFISAILIIIYVSTLFI